MLSCLVGESVYNGGGEDGTASLALLVGSRDSSSRSPKENVRFKPAIVERGGKKLGLIAKPGFLVFQSTAAQHLPAHHMLQTPFYPMGVSHG